MTLTDTELLDLEVPMRFDSYRFELLDQSLSVIGDLPVRMDSPPSISNNTTSRIKRSMSNLELDASVTGDVDTIASRVRAIMTLQNGSEYGLGVFLFGDASRRRRSYGLETSGTMVDQMLIIDQPRASNVTYQAGQVITDALVDLAVAVGVPNISYVPATTVLRHAVSWQIGTTTLKIMQELCALIGYLDPYFDRDGALTFRPSPDYGLVIPALLYDEDSRIIDETIVESDDLLSAPNLFVVISNSVTSAPIVGRFEVPATAPHSFANRGFYVTHVEQMQGLQDVFSAETAAESLALNDPDTYRWVAFDAPADPRHDTFDVVGYLGETYREVSWRLTMGDGKMSHSLRRSYF